MNFCQRQAIGRCSAADRPRSIDTAEMIRISYCIGLPGTATETYCLEGPEAVPSSFVIRGRFGAADTFRLRLPETAADTSSISRNI
jgi:hypothetical protein